MYIKYLEHCLVQRKKYSIGVPHDDDDDAGTALQLPVLFWLFYNHQGF